jgi:hypothetical protein
MRSLLFSYWRWMPWLQPRKAAARTARKTPRALLRLEQLETRVVPALDFFVTSAADSGEGSLRQAVLDANANPGTDSILFESKLQNRSIQLGAAAFSTSLLSPFNTRVCEPAFLTSRPLFAEPESLQDMYLQTLTAPRGCGKRSCT